MTRIIAGAAGGQRLATPSGACTRPTSDRVREALFSRLEHLDALRDAQVLDLYAGSGALGLEALSRGAAGVVLVESVRATAQVARRNARQVAAAVPGLEPGAVVVRDEPVLRYLRGAGAAGRTGGSRRGPDDRDRPGGLGGHDDGGFGGFGGPGTPGTPGPPGALGGFGARDRIGALVDLVLIDPPYNLAEPALGEVLAELARRHLRPGALVVVERSTRSPEPPWPGPSHAVEHEPEPEPEPEPKPDPDSDVGAGGVADTGSVTDAPGPARLRPLTDRAYGETRLWFAEFS